MGQKGSKKGKQLKFEALLAFELTKPASCRQWEQGEYSFQFAGVWEDCLFLWREKRLYVTSCEALHLYERFVLGREPCGTTSPLAMGVMRKKFGAAFLQEYAPLQVRAKRKGRKSDLERELDGSYYKRLFEKQNKGGNSGKK